MLQGESPDTPTVASRSGAKPLVATPTLENFGAIGRNPALAISESLRNANSITPAVTPTKHRSASPATVTLTATHVTQQKSRLSRQIRPPPEDLDMDADGEDDAEENEDETLYCFCQKQSYGDMIACDNEEGCPYEWFHLACVGLKEPTPEKWYCSACLKDKGIPTVTTRKGRKK